jgi:hypothetical protein
LKKLHKEVQNWPLASPLKSMVPEGRCGTTSSQMCTQ